MIAITFALPAESSELIRSIDKDEIAIFHTGVGPKIAARNMGVFLDAQRPEFLISSGFAGGLHDGLGVGDVILCENFSDPELLGRASKLLKNHNVRGAKLSSSSAIADSAQDREQLHRGHGSDAVDMETEAIAAACASRGVRILSLRVITDTTRDPLPAPPEVLFDMDRQKTSFVRLLRYLVAHPAAIPRLMQFSKNIAMARAELTSALLTLLRERHLLFGNEW